MIMRSCSCTFNCLCSSEISTPNPNEDVDDNDHISVRVALWYYDMPNELTIIAEGLQAMMRCLIGQIMPVPPKYS